jgi:hypothetical protein
MVVGFQYLADAHRFLAELKQRLEAFALELHPGKIRIIEFGRFALENRRARGQGKPETFAFLGFTHIFGRTQQGRRLIRRHTVRARLNAKLRQVKATCAGRCTCRSRSRALPVASGERLLQLLRRSDQLPRPQLLLLAHHALLAALPPAAQPAAPADVPEDDADRGALVAEPETPAPLSRLAVRRHDPKAGARCGSSARRDLCGGRRAIAVPTATPRFRWVMNYMDGSGCCLENRGLGVALNR